MRRQLVVVSILFVAAGCSGAYFSAAPSAAGVTTGGAQDIGLARNQVAAGRIPSPDAFVIEGLLSEHDIDITGPKCAKAFCLNTAVGRAPALDTGEEAAFLVLGFSSGIDLRNFRRRPLNLSAVVDRSGSMNGGRIRAARQALHKLVDQLRPGDRFSLVVFDHDPVTLVHSTPIHSGTKPRLHDVIDGISSRGSTDIESALQVGYRHVARHRSEEREDRVILITDAQPNTGRTGTGSFVELMQTWSDHGIGLTVMGVGIDFGQKLTLAMSKVPGSNYFYLETAAKLAKVFDRDFDLLVTPVAWDFELEVNPSPGYRITAAYGIPSWADDAGNGAVRLHVPTLFLSRNRGAIVLRMEPENTAVFDYDAPIGTAHLGYREERRGAVSVIEEDVLVPDGDAPVWDQPGVETAVTLVNTALGLKGAARLAHAGRQHDALDLLEQTDALLPRSFTAEHRLVEDLERLIRAAAPARHADMERREAPHPEGPRWIR